MLSSFHVVEMRGYLLEKKMVFLICYAYFKVLPSSNYQVCPEMNNYHFIC